MRNLMLQSIRALIVFTLLTGVFYPLAVTLLSQGLFFRQANGSLVEKDGKVIGSELLAQNFKSTRYFWPRPSAVDYNAVPGGASNLGPTSTQLKQRVAESLKTLNLSADSDNKPYDLLLSSGSGLDPHITPESALFQVARVSEQRNLDSGKVLELVERTTEKPFLGLIGRERVNVLKLNLALDELAR